MKRAAFLAGALVFALATVTGVSAQGSAEAVPTFSKDVAPILFDNCAVCHRPGEVAPMSLLSYQDARPWSRAIKEKVGSREMPPWLADRRFGSFRNERGLTQEEIDTIVAWSDDGRRGARTPTYRRRRSSPPAGTTRAAGRQTSFWRCR